MAKSSVLIGKVAARLEPVMNFETIDGQQSYTIGQLSSHLRVSLRTLRFYEQAGLLSPDRDGLRRLYSQDDRVRLEVIVTLREFEVSLTAIKSLMSATDGDGRSSERDVMMQVESILAGLEAENLARIEELRRINAQIEDALRNFAAE